VALLSEFGAKTDISASLVKSLGTSQEFVAGQRNRRNAPTWRIDLDNGFFLVLESHEFPNDLVSELMNLADCVRNGLNEMGI
jgi:hypothetical protein